MKAIIEQTTEQTLDSSDAKFTNKSLSKAVVEELDPRRDRQFFDR